MAVKVGGGAGYIIGASVTELRTSGLHASPGSKFYETDTGYIYILTTGKQWVAWEKSVDGKRRVSSMSYLYDIAEGNVSGHSAWDKYANNDDVDSAAEEDVWCVGGVYAWPAAEQQMHVISSSADDDPDKGAGVPGTGVHQVRIYYLDDAFTEKTTDVTLNGTTEVDTTATDIYRINRIRPLVVGTGKKAAGNIDVYNMTSHSTIYTRMATGFTKGRQMVYTVPVSKALYVVSMSGSVGGTTAPKYGKFILRSTYDNVSGSRNAWMTAYAEHGQSSGEFTRDFPCPIYFPAGSDVLVSCKTLDDNCYVTASLRGWLESV